MLDEMWNYRARWKFIGVELGIDMGTLDAIEKDCKMVDDCLLRMITSWLGNCPRPTREVIKVALQSKHVSNATGNYHAVHTILVASMHKNNYGYIITVVSQKRAHRWCSLPWAQTGDVLIFELSIIVYYQALKVGQ